MKCDKCGNGYTGYMVKKKNKTNSKVHEFHYYKCRSHGCNCNQRTTEVNQELQKFVFPEGVTYNREKRAFLTSKVNSLFEPIAQLNSITGDEKNKQGSISTALSNFVGSAGL